VDDSELEGDSCSSVEDMAGCEVDRGIRILSGEKRWESPR